MSTIIRLIILLIQLFISISFAFANSSGTRFGAVTNHDGIQMEVYARPTKQHILADISLGYGKVDYLSNGIKRELNQMPLSAVLAFRLPSDWITAYAGAGGSVLFVQDKKTFGSPIIQAGLEIPIINNKYLSFDYRHQFNQIANYWFGGIGVKF